MRSHEHNYKLDGIGVERIRMFLFLPIPFTTPPLMIQWTLDSRSRKQMRKNQPITMPGIEHCHWFIPTFLLPTPTIWFSQDRKCYSYKWKGCAACDSVSLIFTRLCRSTLLITTSLAETSQMKNWRSFSKIWDTCSKIQSSEFSS